MKYHTSYSSYHISYPYHPTDFPISNFHGASARSGLSMAICRSKRPGLVSAGSRMSMRLVPGAVAFAVNNEGTSPGPPWDFDGKFLGNPVENPEKMTFDRNCSWKILKKIGGSSLICVEKFHGNSRKMGDVHPEKWGSNCETWRFHQGLYHGLVGIGALDLGKNGGSSRWVPLGRPLQWVEGWWAILKT